MPDRRLPNSVLSLLPGHVWSVAWEYEGTITVWRGTDTHGTDIFVKIRRSDETITLVAEAERLRWLRAYVRVPEVLSVYHEGDLDVLVLARIPGRDATDAGLRADPASLVPAMARGLRRFHDSLPVAECPFDWKLDTALEQVRSRVRAGIAEAPRSDDFDLTIEQAVAVLENQRPDESDVVVCHGDYCFPNAMLEDGKVTGYLDVGELGVAHRWWDLAVATWSTTWNVGPGWEDLFLVSYGVERDADVEYYFRVLYDLAS
ncbi:MAG: aminoglycoside 3'-phosphotransferase [Actinobacteria bacterium]|nr:aminoglycoside 3'-phosphotransferase [Actinomycetota bacterium]